MNKAFLGIDTSNYRTSVAAVDTEGNILFQKAVLLDVPAGKRGLRQSEAFFHHSNRLPGYLEELFDEVDPSGIIAVGVSERPRRVEGSYMPCFIAGVNAAREIASALRIPCYAFSHQEGHAAAIMESDGKEAPSSSIFFHLSGGTTEALLCSPDEAGYSMEIVGGTRDISLGQLLDRFGVALGLPFPSGSYLDETAYEVLNDACFDIKKIGKTGVLPKLKLDEGYFNLSGAETRLMRYAERISKDLSSLSGDEDSSNQDPANSTDRITDGATVMKDIINEVRHISTDEHLFNGSLKDSKTRIVAAELFITITRLLVEESLYLSEKYSTDQVYIAGGVASSRTIRTLIDKLSNSPSSASSISSASNTSSLSSSVPGIHSHKSIKFGDPVLSGDNSVGTALLTKRMYETCNSNSGK